MRITELIQKLEEHKATYGDTLVRFGTEIDHLDVDWGIGVVYPLNIRTGDKQVWITMLSD